MNTDKAPLSDLSFFRFPEVTGDVVRDIVLLLVLLGVTVLVTVWVQNRVQTWTRTRERRTQIGKLAGEERMAPAPRAVLTRMMTLAGARDEYSFIHNAEAFEVAAEQVMSDGDEALAADLASLRRTLHLNVMNPELALVSTRQLLSDLPVRLLAHIGEDRLDVYCALLQVDEGALVLEPPENEEIQRLLRMHPQVLLIFWRERDGEAVFRVTLEPIAEGRITAFRARHALRDPGSQNRSAFRLSTDLPVTYRFLERTELGRLRGLRGNGGPRVEGEGRLVDVSYGGASLAVAIPLEERGLAQLQFELHGQPMRLMLEVLSRSPLADGGFLLRGQFRGLGAEARVRLHNILYREQIKRLRDRHAVHLRPGA